MCKCTPSRRTPFCSSCNTDGWKGNVRTERAELNDKLRALKLFLRSAAFRDLADKDQTLLKSQVQTMEAYSFILDKRLGG